MNGNTIEGGVGHGQFDEIKDLQGPSSKKRKKKVEPAPNTGDVSPERFINASKRQDGEPGGELDIEA